MNIRMSLTLAATLLIAPVVHAETAATSATAEPVPVVKAAKKMKRVAVPKPYSNATRSALKAMDSSQAYLAAVAAVPPIEAAASLSPVVTSPVATDLRESSPLATASDEAVVTADVQASRFALDDEAALVEDAKLAPERNTTVAAKDSDALGQESISVIDRVAGKPRAKAIASGPLRVRVKDSGVRASVSIPVMGR